MSEVWGNSNAAAINGNGTSAAGDSDDGKSAADDSDWFAQSARILLPHKAGTALHYATGFDERLCQRYAAGTVKPSAYFFRKLLRGSGGRTWLSAAMDGCTEQWWSDEQRALRVMAAIEREG